MRFFSSLLAAITIALAGCLGPSPTEVTLGEEFELAPNQSARVADTPLIVGFRRVVGDTRCPIDVSCVVEGAAGIELELFGGSASDPIAFNSPFPRSWNDGTYRVDVLELSPNRTAGRVINPDEYRLRLLVDLLPR